MKGTVRAGAALLVLLASLLAGGPTASAQFLCGIYAWREQFADLAASRAR
jgi:hypothetical protein